MATVLLQARMGSQRLPGKVLKEIMGKPMLHYTVETLKLSPVVDKIVLCIPESKENDVLADFAKDYKIECFRGAEYDVLKRLHFASMQYFDNYFFRSTGDNPVLDYENPGRVLEVIEKHAPHGCQYAYEWGMPKGSTVEVFAFDALSHAYSNSYLNYDREHVTTYIRRNLHTMSLNAPIKYRHPFNFSVDTEEDFQRVSDVIECCYRGGIPKFSKVIYWCKQAAEAAESRNYIDAHE